jgi:hypothetical protein
MRTILFIALMVLPYMGKAQSVVGGSLAFGKSFVPSVSWSKTGQKKKFGIGYGARVSGVFSGKQDFITAPAKLTSGKEGPAVLFISELLEENLDTLQLQRTGIFAFNAFVNLQYRVNAKFSLGFNIDVVGFSLGGRQTALFNPENTPQGTTAKPTSLNLLLISDNDIGTLNSELYAQYRVSERVSAKLSLTFAFAEYTAATKLAFDNDRFRSKIPALGLGIAYQLPSKS